jgi:hypothetical protein
MARTDGATLLTTLTEYFARYLFLPDRAAPTLALWTLHTFCFALFRWTPRLHITSVVKRSGKSVVIELLSYVVCKPQTAENIGVAPLFRIIDKAQPTLLIDEIDRFLKRDDELIGMLNAGAKRGAKAVRCVGDGAEPRSFNAFAPVALSGIGALADTLADRSIRIVMKRSMRSERKAPVTDATEAEAAELARKAARWVQDNETRLRSAEPDMHGLYNRAADIWRPLCAVAQVVGDNWPNLAGACIKALNIGDDDAESLREQLLSDLRGVFNDWMAEGQKAGAPAQDPTEMESAEIVRRLVAMEGRPWPDMPGRRGGLLTTAQLARLLVPFGIRPTDIGPKHRRRKGYALLVFEDAFARHLS